MKTQILAQANPNPGAVAVSQPSSVRERIAAIDLSMASRKLVMEDGWTPDRASEAVKKYLQFLELCFDHPDLPIVPTPDVDKMWHAHILDTMAYGPDMQRVFGYFLHHFPYFGLNGPDDEQALGDAYAQTAEIYERTFGGQYGDMVGITTCTKGTTCTKSATCTKAATCTKIATCTKLM